MYDRQVRRRRAVLLALVVCCLALLTAYFGESSGGPLKSVQTGAMEVVAPVQEGANRALKPVRDLFGWFGDTLDAKDQRDKLEAERDSLRQEVARLQVMKNENNELRDLVDYGRGSGIDAYDPVTARVYSRSNSSWYSTIEINKGSSDGLRVNQPVINGKGLVGKVKTV
jgi:rod shape-determining protein MreC